MMHRPWQHICAFRCSHIEVELVLEQRDLDRVYCIGVIQILVYAGAIMVLFVFTIMLLDLKGAMVRARLLKRRRSNWRRSRPA
jgi:NADH-ubiquinone/plastoquinone oxidoreductase subunit 6